MQQKEPPHHSVPMPSPSMSKELKTPEEWKAHWQAQGQEWHTEPEWRTEPEISTQRQAELANYRSIKPDEENSVYPFSGIKLDRADIEWLLLTHANGRGPVRWSDETQRKLVNWVKPAKFLR